MAEALMPARPQGYGRRHRYVNAVFTVNGTAEPVLVSHLNLAEAGLASAVRTAAGKYTFVTLDRWPKCVDVSAHYCATGDAEDMYAQAAPPADLAHASNAVTLVVRTKTAGTNTNPAASANQLSLKLMFEDMPTLNVG